jgi:hypothetical protein
VGDEEGKVNSETFNGAIINAPFYFLHAEKKLATLKKW